MTTTMEEEKENLWVSDLVKLDPHPSPEHYSINVFIINQPGTAKEWFRKIGPTNVQSLRRLEILVGD